MSTMRNKGSYSQLEACRLQAGRLLQAGRSVRDVADIVGVSESSVRRWRLALRKGGMESLKAKKHSGRTSRLTPQQKQRLVKILLQGPCKAGYRTDLWTCARVADIISKTFHVEYHPSHVWKILRELDWSCQKPERRARERNEEAIARWRRYDWPRIKRGPNNAATP